LMLNSIYSIFDMYVNADFAVQQQQRS